MKEKYIKTKYTGIRYKEHPTRKNGAVKKDRYYTIRYSHNGKTKEECLGWATQGWSEEKALEVLSKIKMANKTGEGHKTLKAKREHSKMLEELNQSKGCIKLSVFYDDYYHSFAKTNKAENTFYTEDKYYNKWIKSRMGDLLLKDINFLHINSLKSDIVGDNKSPRTVNYIFSVLKQIIDYAIKINLLNTDNVVKNYKKIKHDNGRDRYLTYEEEKILLDALQKSSQQLYEMTLLTLDCGIRAGEIFNLVWADIKLSKKEIFIKDTKSNKNRHGYMTTRVHKMLSCRKKRLNPKMNDLVFISRKGKKIKDVPSTYARVVKKINFNEDINDRRHILVFHSLRHTFASRLASRGVNLYVIQKLMGHSSFAMTQRYAHLFQDTFKDAISKLEEQLDEV